MPFEAQAEVFSRLGRSGYFKLPKPGTNPRGVEITADAMAQIANHGSTRQISIDRKRPPGEYDQYERWIEYWRLD